jgi:hypothetical protein
MENTGEARRAQGVLWLKGLFYKQMDLIMKYKIKACLTRYLLHF